MYPPEMISGSEFDNKTDMWFLGALLYEMAALKMPFLGKNLME